jgi:hypothetical protein
VSLKKNNNTGVAISVQVVLGGFFEAKLKSFAGCVLESIHAYFRVSLRIQNSLKG